MFREKKILVGITGSIAAYKSILLVRELVKAGAEVKVIMTPAARDFVTPLTLSTLSGQPVLSGLANDDGWANHVMLGRWADIFIIAPLSCNTLAKMAHGQCDNLLLAVYLSATCPVAVAPAMDEDMWHHPSTRSNLEILAKQGVQLLPVGNGALASGLSGEGRMAEPAEILGFLQAHLRKTQSLLGKRALITAGPTHEPLDPVRFIGNRSSGKMGIAIANELAARGAAVSLVLGPVSGHFKLDPKVEKIPVETAEQMFEACIQRFGTADIAVMSAAVADYTPAQPAAEKIKKNDGAFLLELSKTKDILATLGEMKREGQVLVGFALETTNEKSYALQKLEKKRADIIVLNSLNDAGAGFGHDTNKVTIFEKGGEELVYGQKTKQQVAVDIVDRIEKMCTA